jgi:hypothetical protein
MPERKSHEFHCVIGRSMKKRLKVLNVFGKGASVSGIVVRILQVLGPVLGKEFKWGKQRFSRYRSVCQDLDEVREHMHVYMPEDVYREIKLLHHGLNFYSMAQVVRWVVECFLGLVDVFGDRIFKYLKKNYRKWKDEYNVSRKTSRKAIRQLCTIYKHQPEKPRLITFYNTSFSPFWTFRL